MKKHVSKFAPVFAAFLALTLTACRQTANTRLEISKKVSTENAVAEDTDFYNLKNLVFKYEGELVYYSCAGEYSLNLTLKFPNCSMRDAKSGKRAEYAYLSFHAGRIGDKDNYPLGWDQSKKNEYVNPNSKFRSEAQPELDEFGGELVGFSYRSVTTLPDEKLYPIKLTEGNFPSELKISLSSHEKTLLDPHSRQVFKEAREKGHPVQLGIALRDDKGTVRQICNLFLEDENKKYLSDSNKKRAATD